MTGNRWLQTINSNPNHSAWYIERFRTMAAEGKDLDGEARFVDAMVGRNARILDAGCGPGRVGGRLHQLGHTVVGVDIDPALIDAANEDHPGPLWRTDDLAELDLAAADSVHEFDAIVVAGNVMTFLDPATRRQVLERMRMHLAPAGRIAIGFGAGRDYAFDEFFADVNAAGLQVEVKLSSWDLRPFTDESDFLVALLVRAAVP